MPRQKEELEDKLAVEQSRQVLPLDLATVKSFLNYFARKKYESDEARNEFFNSFINRVILYDDKVLIFYNTEPNSPKTVDTSENSMICTLFDQPKKQENSFEPNGFKRVQLGGEDGIRTHVGFPPNGFQDRLVMTASIPLRVRFCLKNVL